MTRTRRSVYANGGTFADPILYWYAVGVQLLRDRSLDSNQSWRFMGAVHGIDLPLWEELDYYTPGEQLPSQAIQDVYWNQCQHGTWFFLPWHRGYVWSIESLLLDAIVTAGGPQDWAMPYWNYSDINDPKARMLPPAFSNPHMPNGAPNPLYIKQRYGLGSTPIRVPSRDVSLAALNARRFTNMDQLPEFGGGKTGFAHSERKRGALEGLPHNQIHVDVGGRLGNQPGLMSDPDTAGLDPIFWLHHTNIDRLWSLWNSQGRSNPSDPAWLSGPVSRSFVMPNPDGSEYHYTPADMLDITAAPLGYKYDDHRAGAAPGLTRGARAGRPEAAVARDTSASMVGANEGALAVAGARTKTRLRLDANPMQEAVRVRRSAVNRAATSREVSSAPSKQRVLLKLENIRAKRDGYIIDVYVNLPDDAEPREREDLLAGSIALFGVRKASIADQPHGGTGVDEVFDVTDIFESLSDEGKLEQDALDVQLVPRREVEDADISVERISVYFQDDPDD